MKKLNTLLVSSLLTLPVHTFANQTTSTANYNNSIDWVADGVFTQGIEGPAVSADGSLYVVNYEKQGTIGALQQKILLRDL
jgi:hypothetical protein